MTQRKRLRDSQHKLPLERVCSAELTAKLTDAAAAARGAGARGTAKESKEVCL